MSWQNPVNDNELSKCVYVREEEEEVAACLPYHSLHPSIYSSSSSSSSSSLAVCRLQGRPPCSDTLTYTQTHTSAMCHYPFHLPLPVIPRSIYLRLLFSLLFFFCSFARSPSVVLSTPPCPQPPPTLCVTAAGKERKMLRPMKVRREKRRKESKRRRERKLECVWRAAAMPPSTLSQSLLLL